MPSPRLPEGNARGFLIARTLAGEVIAYGELVQKPTRGLLTSRLLLHCNDGSLYDETVTPLEGLLIAPATLPA